MEILNNDNAKEKIRAALFSALQGRYGAITEVARRAKVTRQWARLVLQGKYESDVVLQVAADYVVELRKSDELRQQQLLATMQQLIPLSAHN